MFLWRRKKVYAKKLSLSKLYYAAQPICTHKQSEFTFYRSSNEDDKNGLSIYRPIVCVSNLNELIKRKRNSVLSSCLSEINESFDRWSSFFLLVSLFNSLVRWRWDFNQWIVNDHTHSHSTRIHERTSSTHASIEART